MRERDLEGQGKTRGVGIFQDDGKVFKEEKKMPLAWIVLVHGLGGVSTGERKDANVY